jgi:hypothetical protein
MEKNSNYPQSIGNTTIQFVVELPKGSLWKVQAPTIFSKDKNCNKILTDMMRSGS